ncbi:hypothetical protein SDC9_187568 [bioreactor metagenome]|uniref:Uncharacterized protein n=1 Tax=bioreactor metagenome TaxID=1076179 RepID=A0A645HXI5_9ZZZZ|nr:hypothetical protein [Paludibacter sp.]
MSERIFDEMTLSESITRCGELQITLEDTVRLIADKTDHSPAQLLSALQDPGSDEYKWYHNGVAEGNLKLNIDLESNIGEVKAKDAYKNLSGERRRQAINKKLDELFGI